MGEVYRARDSKLNRDVALKVLSAALAQDADYMARFHREAQVLASLNHPNIAQIYGIEQNAIVMELVEGTEPRGPLPLDEALKIARQITEALEAAHEKGIVHRDLKPANIKIKPDGTVKVLDFGLAKAADPASSANADSPTLTLRATQAGVILGTASYMAPEQAAGKPVDRRADIWSFGVVLWELLTGKRLFDGETISYTLADVLRGPIDFDGLPRETPPCIRGLLRRCLDRNVKNRLRDIGEARVAIDQAAQAAPDPAPVPFTTRPLVIWTLASIAIVMSVIAAVAVWRPLRPAASEPRGVVRFTATVPSLADRFGGIALSRDGSRLAFLGGPLHQIYLRVMDRLEAVPIPGTEGAWLPCFSPDGQWISYIQLSADGALPIELKRIALAGGPPQTLADLSGAVVPPTQDWGPDDNILFASNGRLMRIPAAGGRPETVATPDPKKNESYFFGAQLLPGGKQILMGVEPSPSGLFRNVEVAALDPKSGEKKILIEHASGVARYFSTGRAEATGHIVYYDTGVLMAVAFDASRLEAKGSPAPVLDGVGGTGNGLMPLLGISASGTLAYLAGVSSAPRALVWVDRNGAEQPVAAPPRPYVVPALSPDGQRIALETSAPHDIWLYDLDRGTLHNIVPDGDNGSPIWTRDGKRLVYAHNTGSSILSAPADGSGPPSVLATETGRKYPDAVSPDGKVITADDGGQLWIFPLGESDAKFHSFADSASGSRSRYCCGVFSPDGRWMAYQSNESGQPEIYVTPYPGPGARIGISSEVGAKPIWARDGRELFYRNGRRLMAVDVRTVPEFTAGKPRLLFAGNYAPSYDVSPDGKRFLMIKLPERQPTPTDQLTVVVNWFEELRRRVPAEK
jgi:serine/threonine-protein kinase